VGVLAYDSRGRLRKALVKTGGIPESHVFEVALKGIGLLLAFVAWIIFAYTTLAIGRSDFGRLITSLAGAIAGLVQGINGRARVVKDIATKVFPGVKKAVEAVANIGEPLIEEEEDSSPPPPQPSLRSPQQPTAATPKPPKAKPKDPTIMSEATIVRSDSLVAHSV
jgi:hypothetical protein